MKLSFRNRNIILLCIGFLLVGLPVFKTSINEKMLGNIGNGLLMVAVLVFIMGKKKKVIEVEESNEVEENNEIEENTEVAENNEEKHL